MRIAFRVCYGLFALLLLVSVVFAGVDVSAYSVSPSTLKPGLSGTVSISLKNSGSDTVSGVRVIFSASGFTFSTEEVYVGDLASGGTSTVTVPITPNQNLAPGAYNIIGRITWVGGTGENAPYKLFSIPVSVESAAILQAENVSLSKQPIIPGEPFTLSFTLHNTGSAIRDVVVSTNSTAFVLTGQARILLGNLNTGEKIAVQLPFTASTSASSGTQQIPLQFDYSDAFGQGKAASVTITPISVEKRSITIFITSEKISEANPGSKVRLSVNVKNIGNDAASGVVAGISANTSIFTPVGPSEVFVGTLGAGEDKSIEFTLGVNSQAAAGYSPITITLDYKDRTGETQATISKRIGTQVSSRDEVSVITSTKPAVATAGAKHTLSLRFFNVGTSEFRGASVSIKSSAFEVIGSSQEYIGSITLDNPETVQFEIFTNKNLAPGSHEAQYTLDYVDAYNTRKQLNGTVYFQTVSPETVAAYNANGGTSPIMLFIGFVILAAIAWFAYKRFIKKKAK